MSEIAARQFLGTFTGLVRHKIQQNIPDAAPVMKPVPCSTGAIACGLQCAILKVAAFDRGMKIEQDKYGVTANFISGLWVEPGMSTPQTSEQILSAAARLPSAVYAPWDVGLVSGKADPASRVTFSFSSANEIMLSPSSNRKHVTLSLPTY